MSQNTTNLSKTASSRFNEVLEDPAIQELIEFREKHGIPAEDTLKKLSGFYHGANTEPENTLEK